MKMGFWNLSRYSHPLMDVIRCDEPSYLIWKWHPRSSLPGMNNRENAIRWGSSLRVKEGEVAVFVYRQPDGILQDCIEGPFDQIIETQNFPVLAGIVGAAFGGGSPFQAEVYFINLAKIIQIRFGVPFFDVYDSRFPDFGVPVAVRGTISFHIISDYMEFVRLHRLNTFRLSDFQAQIRDAVCRYVKETVANAPADYHIPLVQLETRTAQMNDAIEANIKKRLREEFGVEVSSVDIGAIELDKSGESYRQLVAVTRNLAAERAKAETADYMEKLRIQREEEQYAQRKQTQSAYMPAYQTEKQAEVGVAGANALGQMGGSGSGGFDPAAMMASMAVGGAVGQNLAGTINGTMNGSAQPASPPIPTAAYHIAVGGNATGPFDRNTLGQMAAAGQLQPSSLVWTAGMPAWVCADSVEELKPLFQTVMPPIPVSE